MRQECECGRCGGLLCDNPRKNNQPYYHCGDPAVGYVWSVVKKGKRFYLCAVCYDSWTRLPEYANPGLSDSLVGDPCPDMNPINTRKS